MHVQEANQLVVPITTARLRLLKLLQQGNVAGSDAWAAIHTQ
jgi:hypothetical protein